MDGNDILEFNTTVNTEGYWSLDVLNKLSAGSHTVFIEDEQGNQDSSLIFVQPSEKPEIIEIPVPKNTFIYEVKSVMNVVPNMLLWIMAITFFAFLTFSLIDFFLARYIHKIEKTKSNEPAPSIRKISQILMGISLSFSLLSLAGIGYLALQHDLFNTITTSHNQQFDSTLIKHTFARSGAVRDAYTLEPLANIELHAGNVHITTSETGQFIFQEVNNIDGIRLSNDGLQKELVFLYESGGRSDILFDNDLYNTVTTAFLAELSGDEIAFQKLLDSQSQKAYSKKEIEELLRENVTNSIADISNISLTSVEHIARITIAKKDRTYEHVLRLVVQYEEELYIYECIKEQNQWKLIK